MSFLIAQLSPVIKQDGRYVNIIIRVISSPDEFLLSFIYRHKVFISNLTYSIYSLVPSWIYTVNH